jgi:cell division protease FtsH
MPAPPSVAPFAGLLADLAADLSCGSCCLVVCDKGWTLSVFRAIWERLKAKDIRCEYLDGRAPPGTDAQTEVGIMLTAIGQIRKAVRGTVEGVVFALPHLDVMTTTDGGWTNISREVIPLLYENEFVQWLGFRDPSLPLLPLVERLFTKQYVIDAPYRMCETVHSPSENAKEPEPPAPVPEPPSTDVPAAN